MWESKTREWAWKCTGNLRENKNYRWANWMQSLNGFCRTADLSGAQRTPKTSKQPSQHGKAQERCSWFLLLIFLLHSRTKLGLEGKDVTDLPGECCIPSREQGKLSHKFMLLLLQHTNSWSPSKEHNLIAHLPSHNAEIWVPISHGLSLTWLLVLSPCGRCWGHFQLNESEKGRDLRNPLKKHRKIHLREWVTGC